MKSSSAISMFGALGVSLLVLPACKALTVQSTPPNAITMSEGRTRTTIEAAERKNLVLDSRLGPTPVTFGFQHREWEEFKSKFRPGDELYEFLLLPPPGIPHPYGGYEVVRDGKVIATLITIS